MGGDKVARMLAPLRSPRGGTRFRASAMEAAHRPRRVRACQTRFRHAGIRGTLRRGGRPPSRLHELRRPHPRRPRRTLRPLPLHAPRVHRKARSFASLLGRAASPFAAGCLSRAWTVSRLPSCHVPSARRAGDCPPCPGPAKTNGLTLRCTSTQSGIKVRFHCAGPALGGRAPRPSIRERTSNEWRILHHLLAQGRAGAPSPPVRQPHGLPRTRRRRNLRPRNLPLSRHPGRPNHLPFRRPPLLRAARTLVLSRHARTASAQKLLALYRTLLPAS